MRPTSAAPRKTNTPTRNCGVAGRCSVGKAPVAGIKDRTTNQGQVQRLWSPPTRPPCRASWSGTPRTTPWCTPTNGHRTRASPDTTRLLRTGLGEYVRGMAHTNGLEISLGDCSSVGSTECITTSAVKHLRTIRQRVRGPAQHKAAGHSGSVGGDGEGRGGEATVLCYFDY